MLQQRTLLIVLAMVLVTGVFAVTDYSNASARSAARVATAGTAPATSHARSLTAAAPSLRREVFGFGLASSLNDPTIGYGSWSFSLLSTVAFFGLHINWDGTVVADNGWSVWNSSTLGALLSTAHANGTKVVVTIVLQDFQAGTPNMCAGLINRAVTVGETVAQVKAKGVDGVNVDYEGLNGTCQNGQTSQSMLTDFVRQLRAALPPGSYLSVDTYASSASDPYGFFDVAGLNAYADSFFVMAYDLEYSNYRHSPLNCVRFCLSPTAPLAGYYYNDTTTAAQYVAAVPASKVILGVPYYGRKACVGQAAPSQVPTSGVVADAYSDAAGESTDPSVRAGSYASHRDANDPGGQERWDTWYNTSLACTRELYWDDTVSLGAKYDLVNRDGLRGVGIWNLNYGGGAPELWSALASHFAGCQGATLAATPASQATVGAAVTFTASASGCPNPNALYQFWIAPPGGGWQVVQAYSTSPTFNWKTTAAVAGTYSLSVWVRDAGSIGTTVDGGGRYDARSSGFYTLTSTPCSAVSYSVSPASSAALGTPVTITAKASTCPNPLYQFWMTAPGGSWRIVQAYSTSSTFNWSTTGAAAGTYSLSIWVRDASSIGTTVDGGGRYDARSSGSYALVKPCSAVSHAFSPASPAKAGTLVTITASASGCANPLYQFWMAAPGGSWQIVQAYSTSPTFNWKTTAAVAGTYSLSVWVRDAGSIGTTVDGGGRYDARSSGFYTLTSTPCSAVSYSVSPASSAALGTPVTITAKASTCPNPLYQFWMAAPGGSWQIVQAYSTSSTFNWSTTGAAAGTYSLSIWVRDASSIGTTVDGGGRYDARSSGSYTLQ